MLKLFISYSHKDETHLRELDGHFSVMKSEGLVEVWHDRCFDLGNRVHTVIRDKLEAADVVLFLVSSNFLASDYCYKVEMHRTLERDRQGSVKILPVILRECDWRNAPFGDILAVPTDGRPIEDFSSRDKAYMEVVKMIRGAIARQVQSISPTIPTPQITQQKPSVSIPFIENPHVEDHVRSLLLNSRKILDIPKLLNTSQFSFEVVTVDAYGQKIDLYQEQNQCLIQEIGGGIKLDLVIVPGGKFQMGSVAQKPSQREIPAHSVTIQPFLMSKYPVTKAQWRKVAEIEQVNCSLKLNPSRRGGAQHPVVHVSWHEAVEFCDRLSKKIGHNYRLPTEAEWEYACKAGTVTPFHLGETITSELANYAGDIQYRYEKKGHNRGHAIPVGTFPFANFFGLFDMHGNVWEWCLDHWHENYDKAPIDGSAWLEPNNEALSRVIRGGSWRNEPQLCCSTYRISNNADDTSSSNIGFRVVRSL